MTALDLYKGPATGALDSSTRLALTEWQTHRGVAPTSFLGSMQLAALRAESEDAYQKLLAAQSTPTPKDRAPGSARPTRHGGKGAREGADKDARAGAARDEEDDTARSRRRGG